MTELPDRLSATYWAERRERERKGEASCGIGPEPYTPDPVGGESAPPDHATIHKFQLWQTFTGWQATVVARPEDFCEDYQGQGVTPQSALGGLLAQMARRQG
jgi:hypothetical protein